MFSQRINWRAFGQRSPHLLISTHVMAPMKAKTAMVSAIIGPMLGLCTTLKVPVFVTSADATDAPLTIIVANGTSTHSLSQAVPRLEAHSACHMNLGELSDFGT